MWNYIKELVLQHGKFKSDYLFGRNNLFKEVDFFFEHRHSVGRAGTRQDGVFFSVRGLLYAVISSHTQLSVSVSVCANFAFVLFEKPTQLS